MTIDKIKPFLIVLFFTLWFLNMKEEFVDIDNPKTVFWLLENRKLKLCLLPNPIHMIVLKMDVP